MFEYNYVFELEDKVFDIGEHSLNTCKEKFLKKKNACHSLTNLNFSIILSAILNFFHPDFTHLTQTSFLTMLFLTLKDHFLGVPTVVQWDWQHLGKTGMQAGLITGPAQWVKDLMLPQLWFRSRLIRSI